jgi:hypothetical protein
MAAIDEEICTLCGEPPKKELFTREGKLIEYRANPVASVARELFQLLESGHGGPEIVNGFTVEGAPFFCQALPQFSTVEDFCIYKQAIATQVAPDAVVSIKHLMTSDEDVSIAAEMVGTHTGLGGPCPPANPPKRMTVQYSYVMKFNPEDKLTELHMVFDLLTMYRQWGWPLPGE